MSKKGSTGIFILLLAVGTVLILYPSVSDWWNRRHQSEVIARYDGEIDRMEEETVKKIWDAGDAYNKKMGKTGLPGPMNEEEKREYDRVLDITDGGMMGRIEIPKIHCILPIYHGTSEAVLQIGAGHIPGTSLPVGGKGTHCVLSGHRGLPSAKLFTDLDQLSSGDLFYLHILNRTLAYKVDQILVTEPHDSRPLERKENEDYCTLVTCTPYGINTHRLLVRGHRIQEEKQIDFVSQEEPGNLMNSTILFFIFLGLFLSSVIFS